MHVLKRDGSSRTNRVCRGVRGARSEAATPAQWQLKGTSSIAEIRRITFAWRKRSSNRLSDYREVELHRLPKRIDGNRTVASGREHVVRRVQPRLHRISAGTIPSYAKR